MTKKPLIVLFPHVLFSFFMVAVAISFFSSIALSTTAATAATVSMQQSSTQKKASQNPTRKATKKTLPSHAVSLQETLEKKFAELLKNLQANNLRHNWLQLESQFRQINRSDRSLFYIARSREELSLRSFSAADYSSAVKEFEKMSTIFPKSSLAPEALYRAITIASQKLKDTELANRLIKKLSTSYPKSKEKTKIQALLDKRKVEEESPQQKQKTRTELAERLGLTARTVMIDPGHGGKDPGAEANGITEKVLTLKIAMFLEKELKKLGFSVLFTHTKDKYIALNERIEIANTKNADLFISIHANSTTDASISGLETYYLDAASNSAAEKVAARENSVSVTQVSNLQFILTDLMLTSKTQESKELANNVHYAVLNTVRTPNKKRISNHGVRTAPFYVLMGAKMPAILVEVGYLSNKIEATNLKNEAYIGMMARSIAAGVAKYKDTITQQLK